MVAQPTAPQQQGQADRSRKIPALADPFWSNWALVIVGIWAAWIATGTLKDLKEQTVAAKNSADAAKKSADAAFLNAQAVIDAERPWIIVSLLRDKRNDRFWLTFRASNEGRSPAVILRCFAQYAFTNDPESLPVPPKYGIELPNQVPLLVPNVGHDLSGPFINLYDYAFDDVMSADRERARAIQNGTNHLVFWFKITYTTPLALEAKISPYETRYCCEYTPNVGEYLKIVGPEEYRGYS